MCPAARRLTVLALLTAIATAPRAACAAELSAAAPSAAASSVAVPGVATASAAAAEPGVATPGVAAPGVAASVVPDVIARAAGLKLRPLPRAARLYALNCQGCHGAAGESVPEIPALAGRVGYFARLELGRQYLVQVPNVALNPGSDADIASIMNWVLFTFSRAQLPADFRPYSAPEVGALRRERIEPTARRRQVIAALLAARRIPSSDVLALAPARLY